MEKDIYNDENGRPGWYIGRWTDSFTFGVVRCHFAVYCAVMYNKTRIVFLSELTDDIN